MSKIFESIRGAFRLSADELKAFYEDDFKLDEFRTFDIRAEAEKYKCANEEVCNMDCYKVTYKGIDEKGEVYYRWIYLM